MCLEIVCLMEDHLGIELDFEDLEQKHLVVIHKIYVWHLRIS